MPERAGAAAAMDLARARALVAGLSEEEKDRLRAKARARMQTVSTGPQRATQPATAPMTKRPANPRTQGERLARASGESQGGRESRRIEVRSLHFSRGHWAAPMRFASESSQWVHFTTRDAARGPRRDTLRIATYNAWASPRVLSEERAKAVVSLVDRTPADVWSLQGVGPGLAGLLMKNERVRSLYWVHLSPCIKQNRFGIIIMSSIGPVSVSAFRPSGTTRCSALECHLVVNSRHLSLCTLWLGPCAGAETTPTMTSPESDVVSSEPQPLEESSTHRVPHVDCRSACARRRQLKENVAMLRSVLAGRPRGDVILTGDFRCAGPDENQYFNKKSGQRGQAAAQPMDLWTMLRGDRKGGARTHKAGVTTDVFWSGFNATGKPTPYRADAIIVGLSDGKWKPISIARIGENKCLTVQGTRVTASSHYGLDATLTASVSDSRSSGKGVDNCGVRKRPAMEISQDSDASTASLKQSQGGAESRGKQDATVDDDGCKIM